VSEEVREKGRKDIHAGKVRFLDWVRDQGGIVDSGTYLPSFLLGSLGEVDHKRLMLIEGYGQKH
jgi:hypothetical protein